MGSSLASVGTSRPVVYSLVFISSVLAYFYLFSTPDYPQPHSVQPADFPEFSSHAYVEVGYDEENPTIWPYLVYKSSPFNPPSFLSSKNGYPIADGYLLFTPGNRKEMQGAKQTLPIIMTTDNDLVYCYEHNDKRAEDFRVQKILGKPHLTGWQGRSSKAGQGYGEWFVLDHQYDKTTYRLNESLNVALTDLPELANTTSFIDLHDHEVTPQGTLLVTAYNNTPYDLSGMGGPKDGWVMDSMVYEIDLLTRDVVFSWSALTHVDVTKSRLGWPTPISDGSQTYPYDFFHINSVQAVGNEYLLINSRHYWACYLIDRKTGTIIWTLDGSGEDGGGSFGPLPPKGQFRWQHDARIYNVTKTSFEISIFDNHNAHKLVNEGSSGPIRLSATIPPNPSVPPVVLINIPPLELIDSQSQGSYDAALSNGNQLVGYGEFALIREYGPGNDKNDIRWEGRFGYEGAVNSYRVFKSDWKGTPRQWPPSLVYEKEGHHMKAYVSWNGATEVEFWRLYQVEIGVRITPLGYANRTGFETVIDIPSRFNETMCIVAAAMQNGEEIRMSNRACYGGYDQAAHE